MKRMKVMRVRRKVKGARVNMMKHFRDDNNHGEDTS